jgi:biotin-dependent carboxylase-like uncharacterized protein
MSGLLRVHAAGPLTTVQDRGRVGYAHLGVPRAGPLDPPAAALANRLVGNGPDAARLELTWGGLEVDLLGDTDVKGGAGGAGRWVAVTGAPVPLSVDGAVRGCGRAEWVRAGARVRVGEPTSGVRSYLAVAGGIDVAPVLGSRATDALAWVGPARVADGDELPLGVPAAEPATADVVVTGAAGAGSAVLRVRSGPRAEWFGDDALVRLSAEPWTVTAESNRVGLRLDGPPLERVAAYAGAELASEGMVLGAVQVPPSGRPVVFLADHPTTGGYPVVAVVDPADLARCGQLRPGQRLRFARAR